MVSNRNLPFQGFIFRCYVSFREGSSNEQPMVSSTCAVWTCQFQLKPNCGGGQIDECPRLRVDLLGLCATEKRELVTRFTTKHQESRTDLEVDVLHYVWNKYRKQSKIKWWNESIPKRNFWANNGILDYLITPVWWAKRRLKVLCTQDIPAGK